MIPESVMNGNYRATSKDPTPSWCNLTEYVPGYTGHCPGLRQVFGVTYGEATRKLIRQRRSQSAPGNRLRRSRESSGIPTSATTCFNVTTSSPPPPPPPWFPTNLVLLNAQSDSDDQRSTSSKSDGGSTPTGVPMTSRSVVKEAIIGYTGQ
ncbi:unnamed protein product [Notodromas monacha]|uniref:Ciliary microtubule inner protein 2A-C-like domain-containing protein n=1 Tax=Notodromas monacha TaxID=399045 RepID=A0A7R9BGV1_9CRUS|nr:unnamed protein product [Notodromas monacha]CAG0915223.1 unnamed protein product [Notodromas monacha]